MKMNVVGYMEMNIKESSVSSICSKEIQNLEGYVYVVNGKGIIVSGNDSKQIGAMLDKKIKARLDPKKPGYIMGEVNGKYSIIGYYPSQINDWQYVSNDIVPAPYISLNIKVVQYSLDF